MELGLQGKVAVITGATQGIGKATALRLAGEGANVVLCARGQTLLDAVAAEIRAAGGAAQSVAADVSQAQDCERIAREATAAFGGIDILVNNAGTAQTGEFESVTDDGLAGGPGPEAVRRDPADPAGAASHEGARRRADRQRDQHRRPAAGRALDADHCDPRRRTGDDQGAVEGIRAAQHPGQHRVHRAGPSGPARKARGARRASTSSRSIGTWRARSRWAASGEPKRQPT